MPELHSGVHRGRTPPNMIVAPNAAARTTRRRRTPARNRNWPVLRMMVSRLVQHECIDTTVAKIYQEIFSKVTGNILLCDCWITVTPVVPTSYPAEKFGFEKQKRKMTLEEKFEGRCIMMGLPIDNDGRELLNWVLDKVTK